MRNLLSSIRQFLSELRRRKVYRVAIGYLAASFVVVELADIAAGTFNLPGWFGPMVWVVAGLGLPIAIVLAWALEVTPEGVRVEDTAEQTSAEDAEEVAPGRRSSVPSLWAGASVLALVLLGAWWFFGGLGPTEPATEPTTAVRDQSIAVLPFEVSGAGAEEWRDGMVTALSLNLDGAAGLRAIAARTIFAAWNKQSSAEAGLDTQNALKVGREVGARYAVLGEAVQLGGDLRLGAEVRRIASGERLGQVEVEGSPDSLTVLADRLTREVLGVLLKKSEERVPSVDLASITTSSLDAMKAFLRGERHFRSGEYEAAIEDFETATELDSTFALAYARIESSEGWVRGPSGGAALRRAYELSGQLPRRERRLIRARHIKEVQGWPFEAADSLRRLAEDYPDDPSAWYWLGETIFHGAVPRGWPEADEAFQEAVRLDPGAAPYHHHLVELAFSLHQDSALAARRIEAHPGGPRKTLYETLWDLSFGTASRPEEMSAQLDTLRASTGVPWLNNVLSHPTDLELQAKVLKAFQKREGTDSERSLFFLAQNHLRRGQVQEAVGLFQELSGQTRPVCILATFSSFGYPIPDDLLRSSLEPSRIEAGAPINRLVCAGFYLADRGRGGEIGSLLDRIRDATPGPDTSGRAKRALSLLKGYRAFRAGSLQVAEEHLAGYNLTGGGATAKWRGDLYRELGRPSEAEGWYLAAWRHPVAHERLGQLYEGMGRPEDAAAAYERFIAAWAEADEELQDRVEAARERLRSIRERQTGERSN